MKKLLLLAAIAGCASQPPATPAPAFELSGLDGASVKSSDLWADKPVLLVFMTSWCPACRKEVPRLNEIARTHAVIAIATGDTKEAMERCRAQTGMTYPVLLDEGAVSRAFGIQASPTCILVDKGGAIVYRGSKPPEKLK
ncbi:MAG: TlpA disulfide reductase family protein [Planctomycetota bacterium]